MNIEVTKVEIDTKKQTVTIVGQNLDGILETMDLDTIPSEVEFQFDWGAEPENYGSKRYLTKVLLSQQKRHPEKTIRQTLESLPGKMIFLNNNFIYKK